MITSASLHRNAAGGPSVKGVECRRCGELVGLVQAKSGKWYTCQLVASMNPDSQARVAYPWLSHSRTCGRAAAEQAAERTAREAELRKAITDMQDLAAKLTPEQAADMLVDEAIATWRDLLVREGFDR